LLQFEAIRLILWPEKETSLEEAILRGFLFAHGAQKLENNRLFLQIKREFYSHQQLPKHPKSKKITRIGRAKRLHQTRAAALHRHIEIFGNTVSGKSEFGKES